MKINNKEAFFQSLKRKTSYLAATVVAAFGGLGGASDALAVNVSADGVGQALIYPYYTVRSVDNEVYNTYLSVTNTNTALYKAVKVRFLEGKNSRETLDFNVYLSPGDVWTAALVPVDATDLSLGARMITSDNSCLVPGDENGTAARPLSIDFLTFAYSGAAADGESAGLERGTEGHFEILEQGDFNPLIGINGGAIALPANPSVVSGLLHSNVGVPTCSTIGGGGEPNIAAAIVTGTGGLIGSALLINVENGISYGYDPVVLEDWNSTVGGIWTTAGSITPNLSNVFPTVSRVFSGAGAVTITDWSVSRAVDVADIGSLGANTSLADAVSAILMHNNVVNEFMMDAATNSGTDWVVTFPTKSFYVGNDTLVAGVRQHDPAIRPFQEDFWTGGSCDQIGISATNREESTPIVAGPISIPSPPPPGAAPTIDSLCWEANVLSMIDATGGASNNLGSANVRTVNTQTEHGWMDINFPLTVASLTASSLVHTLPDTIVPTVGAPSAAATIIVSNAIPPVVGAPAAASYIGLPVVGLAVQDYRNDSTTNRLRSFGGAYVHKYETTILP
jgi:hypothetical protein